MTFNRPEAHNAMTFAMYEALHDRCEEADADDDVRALVLRGAGGKAFVAGTDIRQFTAFASGEDGLRYEATIDRIVGRLETVGKPTVALVDGYAMGSGLALSAACDLRDLHARGAVRPADRAHGRQLPVDGELRAAGGAARAGAAQGHRLHRAHDRGGGGARRSAWPPRWSTTPRRAWRSCARRLAGHAPVTMRVTKEALRRLRVASLPDGDDLVREAYASEDFRETVAAFLSRSRA